jgi:hypothetical protein
LPEDRERLRLTARSACSSRRSGVVHLALRPVGVVGAAWQYQAGSR